MIRDPRHRVFEVRFRTTQQKHVLVEPKRRVSVIGTGDLLRYNACQPRPIALFHAAALVDLTGDGRPDLVACVEWSVYPVYRHAALMKKRRPKYQVGQLVATRTTR